MGDALTIRKNCDLFALSGIKVGGKSAYCVWINSLSDIYRSIEFGQQHNLELVPIGAGSNMFFAGGKLGILAMQNNLMGKQMVAESDDTVEVQISSGEIWDDVVAWTVENGWAGIESLSAIPGTVGAAPVQNIGAYGQEVSKVITKVSAVDIYHQQPVNFDNESCGFIYRDSIFKQNPGKFFVTTVSMHLRKNNHPGLPDYDTAKQYFLDRQIANPTLQQIRDGITEIRWSKLPHPEVLPNCGSWFKNPIIDPATFCRMLEYVELDKKQVAHWVMANDMIKLSAGWLVDQTVGKNYENEYFATYGKNALVLVNHSLSPSAKKLLKFESGIINKVYEKFGVTLEREPVLVK
jgi:UDP-N-acetylmuramate dehydrogenase